MLHLSEPHFHGGTQVLRVYLNMEACSCVLLHLFDQRSLHNSFPWAGACCGPSLNMGWAQLCATYSVKCLAPLIHVAHCGGQGSLLGTKR
jgi:hypothetical protein